MVESRTMTPRDDLAAVLGPGNDDATAYAQADSVLDVLLCMCGGAWGIPHHT